MKSHKVEQITADMALPERRWQQVCLIAAFGLPGAGKTTTAHFLGDCFPLVILSTDAIRLKYDFASGPDTITAMQYVAERLLMQNCSVLFDGIHMMRHNRDAIRQFGERHHAKVRFLYVKANEKTIRQRLNQRAAHAEKTAHEGKFVITPRHFQRIAHYFEAPAGEVDVMQVDTSPSQPPLQKQLQSLTDDLQRWL